MFPFFDFFLLMLHCEPFGLFSWQSKNLFNCQMSCWLSLLFLLTLAKTSNRKTLWQGFITHFRTDSLCFSCCSCYLVLLVLVCRCYCRLPRTYPYTAGTFSIIYYSHFHFISCIVFSVSVFGSVRFGLECGFHLADLLNHWLSACLVLIKFVLSYEMEKFSLILLSII